MEIIEKAKALAEEYHKGQKRNNSEEPYIIHPIAVAEMVSQMTNDEELICAAYLHDSVEDINKPEPEIFSLEKLKGEINSLGENVLKYVEGLTHDKSEDYNEYIQRLSKDEKLRIIKICDMIHNVTANPSEKQKEKYRKNFITLFRYAWRDCRGC